MKKFLISSLVLITLLIITFWFLIFPRISTKEIQKPSTEASTINNPICSEEKAEKIIYIDDTIYTPSDIEIKRCTKVTFINNDTVDHWPASDLHPTHGIYPEFDPKKEIKPGQSWSFVFNKAGPWKFHDHLYPTIYGTITVQN